MGTRAKWRSALTALRNGDVSWSRFVAEQRSVVQRLGNYFMRRWDGAGALVVVEREDIEQEMLLAVWLAVESWDPARTPDIAKYVDYQMGAKAQRVLRRFRGWPAKGRPAPAVPVRLDDAALRRIVERVSYRDDAPTQHDDAVRREEALAALARLDDAWQRDVASLVTRGVLDIDTIAARFYAEPGRRIEMQWDCRGDAVRDVRRAVRAATQRLVAA